MQSLSFTILRTWCPHAQELSGRETRTLVCDLCEHEPTSFCSRAPVHELPLAMHMQGPGHSIMQQSLWGLFVQVDTLSSSPAHKLHFCHSQVHALLIDYATCSSSHHGLGCGQQHGFRGSFHTFAGSAWCSSQCCACPAHAHASSPDAQQLARHLQKAQDMLRTKLR